MGWEGQGRQHGQQGQGQGWEGGKQHGGVPGAAAGGMGAVGPEAGAESGGAELEEWLTAEEMRRELQLAAGAGRGRLGRLGLSGGAGTLGSGWLPWRRRSETYDEAAIWNVGHGHTAGCRVD